MYVDILSCTWVPCTVCGVSVLYVGTLSCTWVPCTVCGAPRPTPCPVRGVSYPLREGPILSPLCPCPCVVLLWSVSTCDGWSPLRTVTTTITAPAVTGPRLVQGAGGGGGEVVVWCGGGGGRGGGGGGRYRSPPGKSFCAAPPISSYCLRLYATGG